MNIDLSGKVALVTATKYEFKTCSYKCRLSLLMLSMGAN